MRSVFGEKSEQNFIFFCPQKQKKYTLELELETSVEDVCHELIAALDCDNNEYCELYYNGQVLKKDETLRKQHIAEGSQIEIKIKKSDDGLRNSYHQVHEIAITIKAPQINKSYSVTIMSDKNVKDLANMLIHQAGWPQSKIKFKHNEKVLFDQEIIGKLGIVNGSSLYVNIETFGGS